MMTQSPASGDGALEGVKVLGQAVTPGAILVHWGIPCPSQGRGWGGGRGFTTSGLTCCLRVMKDQERTARMMLLGQGLASAFAPWPCLSPSERLGRRKEFDTHKGEEESRARLF